MKTAIVGNGAIVPGMTKTTTGKGAIKPVMSQIITIDKSINLSTFVDETMMSYKQRYRGFVVCAFSDEKYRYRKIPKGLSSNSQYEMIVVSKNDLASFELGQQSFVRNNKRYFQFGQHGVCLFFNYVPQVEIKKLPFNLVTSPQPLSVHLGEQPYKFVIEEGRLMAQTLKRDKPATLHMSALRIDNLCGEHDFVVPTYDRLGEDAFEHVLLFRKVVA